MGTGRIRMFSLWVMVVILLLLGVDQGHARPLTWPGGPPDYWETPNWANTPPIPKFVDTVAGLDVPCRREQPRPVHPRGHSGYHDLLGIRLLRDRARAVPGEDAHEPAGDAAARLRAALDERGARGPYAPFQREPERDRRPRFRSTALRPSGWPSPTTLGPSSLPRKTGRCVSSSSTRCRRGRRATSSSRWTEPSWGRGST